MKRHLPFSYMKHSFSNKTFNKDNVDETVELLITKRCTVLLTMFFLWSLPRCGQTHTLHGILRNMVALIKSILTQNWFGNQISSFTTSKLRWAPAIYMIISVAQNLPPSPEMLCNWYMFWQRYSFNLSCFWSSNNRPTAKMATFELFFCSYSK